MSTHPMFDPIGTVSVLWGPGTASQHALPTPAAASANLFAQSLGHINAIEGDGLYNAASRFNVNTMVEDIAQKFWGRRMFVAIMDGHNGATNKPWHLWEGKREAPRLLERLVAHTERDSAPIDVFMLVARNPAFIHKYAQDLPVGSRVVAVQTPDRTGMSGWLFNCLFGQNTGGKRGRSWRSQPDAKDLLLDLLASDKQTFVGAPEIAVSGSTYLPLNRLWQEYASANAPVKIMAFHDWSNSHRNRDRTSLRQVSLSGAPAGRNEKVTSSTNYLALAAECFRRHEQALLTGSPIATAPPRPKAISAPSVPTRPAPKPLASTPVQQQGQQGAGQPQASPTAAPRAARRPSAHEIANTPPWLRRALHTTAGRRLLRKG